MLNAALSLILAAGFFSGCTHDKDVVPEPKPSSTVQADDQSHGKTSTSETVRNHHKKNPKPPTSTPSTPPPNTPTGPADTTAPKPCPEYQVIDGRAKCRLVTHHPRTRPPPHPIPRSRRHTPPPRPHPRLGPDPSVNEWNMLAVGYPIWLWTDQPNHLATTAHHDGLTFTSTPANIPTLQHGRRQHQTMRHHHPLPRLHQTNQPHLQLHLRHPSPIGHPYTLTATTTWTINWTTTGHHGTLTHTTTGTRTLEVGELQSLIIG